MGMVVMRLHCEQIDYVDDSDSQIRSFAAQEPSRGQSLHRGNVTGCRDYDVGLTRVAARPRPYRGSFGAMPLRGRHVEPLRHLVFRRHDEVDVVTATQAM